MTRQEEPVGRATDVPRQGPVADQVPAPDQTDAPEAASGGLLRGLADLPFIRRPKRVFDIYGKAGGSLLAEGLAYSALFASLTGLLLMVALLGYVVPSESDRQRIIDAFSGELAPFAPIARTGLRSLASNASAFSVAGLAGLAWGASHFYGSLDQAFALIFNRTKARGPIAQILRGFVSLFLLAGGLASGIAISALGAELRSRLRAGQELLNVFDAFAFPVLTAIVVVIAVAIVYRVVPNTRVPLSILRLPAVVAGVAITILAEMLVYLVPLLPGSFSWFGGVATVFAALAWLHLAFQVLLIGGAWTRIRLDDWEASRA